MRELTIVESGWGEVKGLGWQSVWGTLATIQGNGDSQETDEDLLS
jgi:hypothetical protein